MIRRDLCTWAKGLEIKMKLSSLEQWLRKPENKDWTGDQALKMLEPGFQFYRVFNSAVRQLVSVLSVDKQILTNKEIRETICPLINLVQLKQVLSMYQHDEMLEDPVPITLIYSIVHLPGIDLWMLVVINL